MMNALLVGGPRNGTLHPVELVGTRGRMTYPPLITVEGITEKRMNLISMMRMPLDCMPEVIEHHYYHAARFFDEDRSEYIVYIHDSSRKPLEAFLDAFAALGRVKNLTRERLLTYVKEWFSAPDREEFEQWANDNVFNPAYSGKQLNDVWRYEWAHMQKLWEAWQQSTRKSQARLMEMTLAIIKGDE